LLARARGRLDIVPLRTRVIDDAWHHAHAAGTRQLVLLGAGFDGRAFCLDDIGDTTVFEVDHPATQAAKRERARALVPRAENHVYVPVDFERDRLVDAIAAAGQSISAPTFFVWEGVTAYLTAPAQEATLRAIYERSAPGSRLVMTYVVPNVNRRFAGLRLLFSLVGEPFLGEMTREKAAERLTKAGLRVVEDTDPAEWRRRYARPRADAEVGGARIALAER
jgi:methyltransferase (TIGR00027 family)